MNRRGFLNGLIAAPAIVTFGNIMPVRQMLWTPQWMPLWENWCLLAMDTIDREAVQMFDNNGFFDLHE